MKLEMKILYTKWHFITGTEEIKDKREAVGELKHLLHYLPEAISTLTVLTDCLRSPILMLSTVRGSQSNLPPLPYAWHILCLELV